LIKQIVDLLVGQVHTHKAVAKWLDGEQFADGGWAGQEVSPNTAGIHKGEDWLGTSQAEVTFGSRHNELSLGGDVAGA
jgi:hypothetical protein